MAPILIGSGQARPRSEPRLDKRSEPRFWYTQRFNLAVNFSHLGRHTEARDLLEQVRDCARASPSFRTEGKPAGQLSLGAPALPGKALKLSEV